MRAFNVYMSIAFWELWEGLYKFYVYMYLTNFIMKTIKSALEVLKLKKSSISGQPYNTAAVIVLAVALEMSKHMNQR